MKNQGTLVLILVLLVIYVTVQSYNIPGDRYTPTPQYAFLDKQPFRYPTSHPFEDDAPADPDWQKFCSSGDECEKANNAWFDKVSGKKYCPAAKKRCLKYSAVPVAFACVA